ncbi:MAG: heme-binding protein [Rhodospirillales bacterium]|nr:heme-binding protein [Rhodospirillales bacterium]
MRELTLVEIDTLMKEGIAYCQSAGRPSSIAVVDMGGNMRGVLRPEKGRIANVDIAYKKAWTAVAFQRPTAMLQPVMVPGAFGYGLTHTDNRICIVGGGFPIYDEDGDMIGGIGVSGGSVDEDCEGCLVGMRKLGFPTEFENPLAGVKMSED